MFCTNQKYQSKTGLIKDLQKLNVHFNKMLFNFYVLKTFFFIQ